jgi:hypothetical protein
MLTFLIWVVVLVLCWPLAILALLLYPFVWLLLLPFRILGIAVGGVLSLFKAVVMLPSRLLGGRPA